MRANVYSHSRPEDSAGPVQQRRPDSPADPIDPHVELADGVIGGRKEADDARLIVGDGDPVVGHHLLQQKRGLLLDRVRIEHADALLEARPPRLDQLDGVTVAIERSDLKPGVHPAMMARAGPPADRAGGSANR